MSRRTRYIKRMKEQWKSQVKNSTAKLGFLLRPDRLRAQKTLKEFI